MTKNDPHKCPTINDNDPTNIKPLRNKKGLSTIRFNIISFCFECGNEDAIDTYTGLCPSCLNESYKKEVLNNE